MYDFSKYIDREDNELFFRRERDGIVKVYDLSAYLIIFDDFCMAFYDQNPSRLDMHFLKEKFDEFSIASCTLVLSLIQKTKHIDNEMLLIEIHNAKSKFEFVTPSNS